jgi:transcriptional regulator of acetoin/glycerol metabolism
VRELQNAVERAVVLGKSPLLGPADLPVHVRSPSAPAPASASLADVERAHIRNVLDGNEWNVTRAARLLGVDRGTLYHKIRKYDLERRVHGG